MIAVKVINRKIILQVKYLYKTNNVISKLITEIRRKNNVLVDIDDFGIESYYTLYLP